MRKILSLILILMLIVSGVPFDAFVTTGSAINFVPGDVNSDGEVNGKDITILRRYNANWNVSINALAADVNADGEVNGKDITLLRRYNANWNVQLKPGLGAETEEPTPDIPNYEQVIITLDAGHGGTDSGAISATAFGGKKESEYTLTMCLYMQERLLQYSGATVYMTRTTDTSISLEDRATIAKNNNSNAFISVHCNSYDDASAAGSEVYTAPSTAFNYSASQNIATRVLNQLVSATGNANRGVMAKDYTVLTSAASKSIPVGILIETGFVSNQGDYNRIFASDELLKKAAYAMADGVAAYYGLRLTDDTNWAPVLPSPDYIGAPVKNYKYKGHIDFINGIQYNLNGYRDELNGGVHVIPEVSGINVGADGKLVLKGWALMNGGQKAIFWSVDGENWVKFTGTYADANDPILNDVKNTAAKLTNISVTNAVFNDVVADVSAFAGRTAAIQLAVGDKGNGICHFMTLNITVDAAAAGAGTTVSPSYVPAQPAEIGNFKAIWISQFDLNPIYVKSGSQRPEADFRSRINQMMTNIANDGYNAVIVQVRPNADSMYPSAYYPPSKYVVGSYGRDFTYDPFAIIVEIAHQKNLDVHAWINPMRGMSDTEMQSIDSKYLIKQWYNDPSKKGTYLRLVTKNNETLWYLNPAYEEVRNLIVSGAVEIVNKYDVEGVHMDDYFYPVDPSDTSFDAAAYAEYSATHVALSTAQFRRNNLNRLVSSLYANIKRTDPTVLFGISPAGNLNNVINSHCADVYSWCSVPGFIDYIMPQIYWGFDNATYPFASMCATWQSLVKTDYVKLIIGVTFSNAANPTNSEFINSKNVLARSLTHTTTLPKCAGITVYCYQYLFDRSSGAMNSATQQEHVNFNAVLKNATWPAASRS